MAEDRDVGRESFSQFLARVLDQLSITSWMPALALVGSVFVLTALARTRGSISDTMDIIADMRLVTVFQLVAAVILAALFTQAFEFEAIRMMEGYWRATGRRGGLSRLLRRRKLRKLDKLSAELQEELEHAISKASRAIRTGTGIDRGTYDLVAAIVLNEELPSGTEEQQLARARVVAETWRSFADPIAIAKVEDLEARTAEYPATRHRVLPTRLGNIVRAVEEQVHNPSEGRLETYAIHVLDELPLSIRAAFREQRRRLDLYCSLTFVMTLTTIAALGVAISFPPRRWLIGLLLVVVSAVLTFFTYRAVIASGRKFGLALYAIREHKVKLAESGSGSSVS